MPGPAESPSGVPRFSHLPRVFSLAGESARGRGVLRVAAGLLTAVLWLQFLASLPAVHRVRVNDFPAYWAAGRVLARGGRRRVLIGKDTRISGYMFESVLEAGLTSSLSSTSSATTTSSSASSSHELSIPADHPPS